VADPPSGQAAAAGSEGRVRDEVPQNSFQGGAFRVGAQEVGPDAREAVEEVALSEGGQVAGLDAGERCFGAAVGESVICWCRVLRAGVYRRWKGGETVVRRKPTAGAPRERPVVLATLVCPEAVVGIDRWAERQEPPYRSAISMCRRLIPAAPSARDCTAQDSSGVGERVLPDRRCTAPGSPRW
jgi:hypothetical protein